VANTDSFEFGNGSKRKKYDGGPSEISRRVEEIRCPRDSLLSRLWLD
jgi:hypothetical protein